MHANAIIHGEHAVALYLYQTHINATFQQVNELLCKRLGILYGHLEQHDRFVFR